MYAGRIEVIGYDLDAVATRNAKRRLSRLPVKVDILQADFLDTYENHERTAGLFTREPTPAEKFDLVISNPPYVRTQVLGAAKAKQLAERFDLTGRVDLYHAFAVAMWSALSPVGVIALLTSNRFMTIQSGAAMRRLLRERFHLQEVFDLGDTKLFGAAVLPAVVIGRKASPSHRAVDEIAFGRVYEERSVVDSDAAFDSVLDALRKRHTGAFRVNSASYRSTSGSLQTTADPEQPWVLRSEESHQWLAAVEKNCARRFGEVAEVRVGIKTTADNVFIRKDWSEQPAAIRPERKLLRSLLTHHVAAKWTVSETPKTEVLYPHYADEKGCRRTIALEDFQGARSYFELHRDQLAGRKYVSDAGRKWYEIWVPQQPADWERPKVVYPDIAESPTFFFDGSGHIVNGDCYWIVLKDGFAGDWLYLLLGVANSSFSIAFYDAIFHNKLYAGRRRFMTQYVRQFPLPPLVDPNAAAVVELVKMRVGGHEPPGFDELLNTKVWASFGLTAPMAPRSGTGDHKRVKKVAGKRS